MKYTLSEVNNLIESGIDYDIPDELLDIINKLSSQVGAPNYVKTPVFTKRSNEKDKRVKPIRRKKINDEWTKKPIFRTTKIEKSVGLKKNIDDIRLLLNKLSNNNYNEIFENIVDIIDELESESNKNIGDVIFELASSNRFYSETYAKIYSKLANRYDFMNDTLRENCNVYIEMFNDMEYADPNDNYEGFCEMNKVNERRRSLSAFLVNLMKNNVLTREEINCYLVTLMHKFDKLLNTENMKNEASEICENICILFDIDYNYDNYIVSNDMSINNYLGYIATCSVSKLKSYTNKTKFQIMDLLNI